jgi:UDP-glucose 6-dehydrogenase
MRNAVPFFGKKVRYAKDIQGCLQSADHCFIVTEWHEFRAIPPDLFIRVMAHPIVVDCRRVLKISKLDPRIKYRAIGLGWRRRKEF